jgi:alpha-glucosidase
MGERIHDLRLGNNFTATFFAADAGDPIDGNIYGNHPFYLDTRYYEVDEETGAHSLITDQNTTAEGKYVGISHGVYQRSAHPMEVLLLPTNVTWRALGGSIDLYFFDGPSQPEVTRQYQVGAIGLPAMQQYWGFGFHQCRWGYKNWSETEDVVNNYRNYGIPLETIWNDIDCKIAHHSYAGKPC